MISFRYHVVSLVAVLLALAAGIALGSGPLQGTSSADITGTGESTTTNGPGPSQELQQSAAFADAYAASTGPTFLPGRLKGRAVTVLTLPDAAPAAVRALTESLATAGAAVTGTVHLSPALVSAGSKQLVDELGGQLEAASPNVRVPPGAGSYDRMGVLLARAVGTKTPGGARADKAAQGILAGLTAADLVTTDAPLQRLGSLMVMVAGPPPQDAEQAEGTGTIVSSLLRAMDAGTGGVVLAGPVEASAPGGALSAVRSDAASASDVSTVEAVDHPVGRVVTVLALAEQAEGLTGHYGVGEGATGVRPGVPAAGD